MVKTFPNHWTLVTGLYQENHGILNNRFSIDNRTFVFTKTETQLPTDYGLVKKYSTQILDHNILRGEPIWETLERQNGTAGVHFWPGSEVRNPTYWEKFVFKQAFQTRMDAIVENLSKCDLSIGYFEEPDLTGHEFGPESPKIKEILQKLDYSVGYLIEQLKETDQFENTNIVFVSGISSKLHFSKKKPLDKNLKI